MFPKQCQIPIDFEVYRLKKFTEFYEKFIKQVYTPPKYYEMSSQETDYTDMESIDGMEEHDNMYNINGTRLTRLDSTPIHRNKSKIKYKLLYYQ